MELALRILVLVLIFTAGALVGSFLNVVIYRLLKGKGKGKGKGIALGGSYCPHCEHKLSALDLLPVVSYFLAGRTCRYCKKPISPRFVLIEILTGALALVSALAFLPPGGFLLEADAAALMTASAGEVGLLAGWLPFDFPAFGAVVVSVCMVFCVLCLLVLVTFIDASTMEIPNSLSIGLAVLGVLSIFIGPTAALPPLDHLIGAVCISVPMFLIACIFMGSFGFGDVKLMAAAGLFLGWQNALVAAFIGILLGGIYGIYLLAARKKGRKEHFAFGPALSAGIAVSIFLGSYIISWYSSFL